MGIARKAPLFLAAIMAIAFAVPAVASASEWTKEGAPITEPEVIELSGSYTAILGGGSYGNFQCTVQGEATLMPGDEGEITNFVATSNPCPGNVVGCKVSAQYQTPWQIEARASDILVDDWFEKWNLNCGGVPFSGGAKGDVVMTPDNPEAMSLLTLEGEMADINTSIPFPLYGELEVTPAETYGFQ